MEDVIYLNAQWLEQHKSISPWRDKPIWRDLRSFNQDRIFSFFRFSRSNPFQPSLTLLTSRLPTYNLSSTIHTTTKYIITQNGRLGYRARRYWESSTSRLFRRWRIVCWYRAPPPFTPPLIHPRNHANFVISKEVTWEIRVVEGDDARYVHLHSSLSQLLNRV